MNTIYNNFIIIILSLLLTVTISCARQQNNATESNAPVTEDSQAPVDTNTIESYWTKERMDEATPVPVPTTPPSVVYPPRAPEAPQSIEQ